MNGNISCILFLPFSFTQDQCKFRCYRSLYGKVIVEETRKPSCFAPSSRLRPPRCCHGKGTIQEEKDSLEQPKTRSSFFGSARE